MTPEELKQLAQEVKTLTAFMDRVNPLLEELGVSLPDLQDVLEWKKEREIQQISAPLDDASLSVIGAVMPSGPGTSALTQVYTDSGGDTFTGPKAYLGTKFIMVDGELIEIPYLTKP